MKVDCAWDIDVQVVTQDVIKDLNWSAACSAKQDIACQTVSFGTIELPASKLGWTSLAS